MATGKPQSSREDYLTIVVIGLVALLSVNFVNDFMFTDINNKKWDLQIQINTNLNEVNILQQKMITSMNEDIESNMKVINQLIGIMLRGDV